MSALEGKIIISTGSEEKSDKITKLLKIKGASVFNFPMIKIKHAEENEQEISKVLKNLNKYDIITFTSGNGVKYFFYWLKKLNIHFDFTNTNFATIGKATGNTLKSFGINPDYVSDSKNSEEFANKLIKILIPEKQNILIPTGNLASNKLTDILSRHHKTEKLIVYKTDKANILNYTLSSMIKENCYDLIIFLSPSAVNSLIDNLPENIKKESLRCVAVGSTTQKALNNKNITPAFIPSIPDIDVMIKEMDVYYQKNQFKNII